MLARSFVPVFAVAIVACTTAAQATPAAGTSGASSDFHWQKKVAAGRLEISDSNGPVHVEPATGADLDVTAVKRGKAEDFAKVTVRVEETDGLVQVCALWPGDTACGDHGRRDKTYDRTDVSVEITVRVPATTTFVLAQTMNGEVTAKDMTTALKLRTMNGSIDASTKGAIEASTMNGKVTARVATKGANVQLSTQNGRIELALPDGADADVEAATMRGEITSAFGAVPKAPFPGVSNHATFRIGNGGTNVTLKTMNGDVKVTRGA